MVVVVDSFRDEESCLRLASGPETCRERISDSRRGVRRDGRSRVYTVYLQQDHSKNTKDNQ